MVVLGRRGRLAEAMAFDTTVKTDLKMELTGSVCLISITRDVVDLPEITSPSGIKDIAPDRDLSTRPVEGPA